MSASKGVTRALLLDVATALTLLSALVYLAGWTYAYHYFGQFKLGLLMLDIPTHYYFMYGFWVFKAWVWIVIAVYLLLLLPFPLDESYLLGWLRKLKVTPFLQRNLEVLLIVLAFWLSWWLAVTSAASYYQTQQQKGFIDYPNIRVWLKSPAPNDAGLQALYQALPQGGYRLLLQNEDKLFLLKPPQDGKPARIAVTQLALSEVRALRVLP
ncbi:MAG: hypothetical protein KDJ99_09140 [Candidatus Competibacteraceae bacterium]|nr:hypothetical protein [Candidatus Competibacteraceae bacterium]